MEKFSWKNGRFRKMLVTLILKKNSTWDDFIISPKIRQTLQHWGYQLTKEDFISESNNRKNNRIISFIIYMILKCEINHKFCNHIENRKKTMVSTRTQKSIQKKRKIVRWTSDEECALKFLYTNRKFCIYKIEV